jgi:Amt family ammonium transporter
LIGAIGGAIVVLSVSFFDKLQIDDPVGAISVHGVVGIWGLLAVTINADVTVMAQLTGAAVIFAWTFVASSIVWYILKLAMGIRVSEEQEYEGVDASECGIDAYPEFVNSKS